MTNGWDGADPLQQDDGLTSYELATRFTANANITITGIRVWAGTSLNVSGRNARLWTTAGVLQRTVDIDDTLPAGWTTYTLVSALDITSGSSFDVSYTTTRYYGAITGDYPNPSSDSNITATSGRFIESSAGVFPTTPTTNFYGIDIVYSLTGGNLPPVITGMTILKSDMTVQPTITLTDESPSTITALWDWGDGTTTNTGAGVLTSMHTYSTAGNYAVMVTVTDNGGLTDTFASAVFITAAGEATDNEEWFDDILDAVVSDVQRSGYFEKVNQHEPKKGPRTGLTAAVWLQAMDPIALASGLAATSARIIFTLRMYQSFMQEPQDLIDPTMARAASNLMRRYHDDFDFDGAIRNVDLLGMYGIALTALSGYLEVDGKVYRIIDITIPCIVNDVWPQVS